MGVLKITQKRSEIGHAGVMRRTLQALGLRGYQRSVEQTDTPQIRGMIHRVKHLVAVEEVPARSRRPDAGTPGAGTPRAAAPAGTEAP